MKLLILSDSHGCIETMEEAIRKERPDMVVHLGDYWADGELLQKYAIPVYQVVGNCDRYRTAPGQTETICCNIEGVPFFMTHGHHYGVKMGLERLYYGALEAGAEVALFGHTHDAYCCEEGDLLLMNPGSCGSFSGTYGVIEVSNGEIQSAAIHDFTDRR